MPDRLPEPTPRSVVPGEGLARRLHASHSAAVLRPPTAKETERLRLRRPLPTDAIAVLEYASDAEVTHHMDWPACTLVDAAMVSLAFSIEGIHRVWTTCDAENLASARVLERSGLVREGLLRFFAVRPDSSSEPRDAFVYPAVRKCGETAGRSGPVYGTRPLHRIVNPHPHCAADVGLTRASFMSRRPLRIGSL